MKHYKIENQKYIKSKFADLHWGLKQITNEQTKLTEQTLSFMEKNFTNQHSYYGVVYRGPPLKSSGEIVHKCPLNYKSLVKRIRLVESPPAKMAQAS